MEINLENMIIIKKEWFRSTCPMLRVTTKRIRLNKIGLSALNNPKNWNPEYQYRLLGEKHNDQLHFQLESVMVKQEKD